MIFSSRALICTCTTDVFYPVDLEVIVDAAHERIGNTTEVGHGCHAAKQLRSCSITTDAEIAFIIEYQVFDVIATGTPGGVGDRREPPVYMKAGDVIEIEITGLGTLRNVVSNAA